MGDWISGAKAAEIMGVHRNTVRASLEDLTRRKDWWGAEGDGWRFKPLTARKIYEVKRQRAEDIAAGKWPPKDEPAEAPADEPTAPEPSSPE